MQLEVQSSNPVTLSDNVEVSLVYPRNQQTFRRNDGLPIKLAVRNTALITATCMHGTVHQLQAKIQPRITWTIEGPPEEKGAFKIGHSDGAKYHRQDTGESVIYYPPPDIPDEAEIQVKLLIKGVSVNTYNLLIRLKREKGLGKGISYSADVTIDCMSVSNIAAEKCSCCSIDLLIEEQKKTIQNDGFLMTDENIKVQAAETKGRIWLLLNGQRHILKGLHPASFLHWDCNMGSFVAGNEGGDVIYQTPAEKDLSRSPVVITLSEGGKILETKKFWLLRRPSVMHC